MTMPTPASCLSSSPDTPRPWLAAYPAGIDWNLPLRPRSLTVLFADAVERFGPRPCLEFLGARTTYAEVGRMVDRAAKGFRALGVGPGVKVGLCLPNSPYSIICFFGVLKAGGTVVNYNPLYVERELEHQIADSETDIMVTIDLTLVLPKIMTVLERTRLRSVVVCSLAAALPAVKRPLFRLLKRADIARPPAGDSRFIPFEALVANDGVLTPPKLDPETTVAVLQYTGGTTGVPKGAMLTHANLTANVAQVRAWFPGVREGQERILAVLPFFHVFAMTIAMNLALDVGSELILLPRFEAVQVLQTIHKRKPTLVPGVPTMFKALLGAPDAGRYSLRSIRFCISGGAPLPVELKHAFEAATGCTLVEGYGLTETSPVSSANPLKGENKAGSIGLPLPGVTVEIRSLDDPSQPAGKGEKGEVVIAGPHVMAGYWRRPDETADTIRNGFLHTGDVGIMDDEGYIFLLDRLKDLIICGGYNVYPRVIEEAIYQHPDVVAVCAIGLPHEYRGQTPKAFVQVKPGSTLTPDGLRTFLADRLSKIEMPTEIEFRDELPKTAVGKLSKKELIAEAMAQSKEVKKASGTQPLPG